MCRRCGDLSPQHNDNWRYEVKMIQTTGPIKYMAGYKYQLSEDWSCFTGIKGNAFRITTHTGILALAEHTQDGWLHVKAGYAWDGPSGPTLDTPSAMRGSLAHDVLYQAMRLGKLPQSARKVADDFMLALCSDDGMSWWRRAYFWRALRSFAAYAAARQPEKILRAP
jgi:hypothetical protein